MITECELYIHCWLILAFFVRLLWWPDDGVVASTIGPGSTRNGAAAAAAIRHIGLRLSHRHNLPIFSHGSCVVTHSALPVLASVCAVPVTVWVSPSPQPTHAVIALVSRQRSQLHLHSRFKDVRTAADLECVAAVLCSNLRCTFYQHTTPF